MSVSFREREEEELCRKHLEKVSHPLFIFPAFLIYTAFVIVSIIWAGYYSFFDWGGVGEKVFVGLKNYIELVTQDEVFRATIGHTLVYTVINVAIQVFGGLLFAILLSRIKKEELLYRLCIIFR